MATLEQVWARSSGQPIGTFRLEAIVPQRGIEQLGQIARDGVWYFVIPVADCPGCGQQMDAGNLAVFPLCPRCTKADRQPNRGQMSF